MKTIFCLLLFVASSSLFTYQGQNPNPGFIFPIDGGRKVTPIVDTQKGMEFEIGYLTVTSIDAEGALNPTLDQQNVNQLLTQINALYVQIYNKYNTNAIKTPAPYTPPSQQPSSAASCSHRRASKWRQS